MNSLANDWLQLIFRWTHVVAGVIWIGHLYFFNWVNGPLAKTYDADSKKKVVPELMPRAAAIHLGAAFATIMAMNVWMRIWPAQRKIIAAVQAGTAPDAALVGRAGLRSKHNTYMSVPLVLAMVNQHHLTILAGQPGFPGWAALTTMVAVGWVVVKLLYMKSAGPTPAKF